MNERELESLRRNYLIKLLFQIILTLLLLMLLLFEIMMLYINIYWFNPHIFIILTLAFSFSFLSLDKYPKKYESIVKKYFIKNELKDIPNLEIHWETFNRGYFSDIDCEKRQKLKIKFEKFDNERKIFQDKLSTISNNCFNLIDKRYEIKDKQKEFFSKQDKENIEELNVQLKELYKNEKDLRIEQYKIDCAELEKLNLIDRKVTQDSYRIQYLKEKIKEYEEKIKILNLSIELSDLETKNIIGTSTESEKAKIDYLKKKLKENSNKNNQYDEGIHQEFAYNIINFRFLDEEDDIFWGIYNGTKFSLVEFHSIPQRYRFRGFNGTVLQLKLNDTINNKILVLKNGYSSIYVNNGLQRLNIELPFRMCNYKIYAKYQDNIDYILKIVKKIITNKNYSYVIEDENLYVVIPHERDKYKFGSLFKKFNDKSQFQSFYKDINEILKIIEYFSKYFFQ